MFVYSKAIIQFAEDLRKIISQVLTREAKLKCTERRFLDKSQQISYPIQVIIYNHRSMLGYFDSAFYELGFHERLIHCPREKLVNIVRHELAHYLLFIQCGPTASPHSTEFRQFCKQMGWGPEVYQASMSLDELPAAIEESAILRKVKKLMALSASHHANEAEVAMLKSQELLLKHHLDSGRLLEESEKILMKRVLKQKKESAKMRAIGKILETFFVGTVYHRSSDGFIYLEIFGESVNLEIAEYVAGLLNQELDYLWKIASKGTCLKGVTAKNSFFLGVAKGYCQKVEVLKKNHAASFEKALIVLEKKLSLAKDLIYPRLSSKNVSGKFCPASSQLGEKAGQNLTINPALKQETSFSKLQLK